MGSGDPRPVCGNGLVEQGEDCDQGMENGTGGACKDDCTLDVCGDGYQGPGEQCDDGNQDDSDACTSACTAAACGDGHLQLGRGEQCDDGARNDDHAACTSACQIAACDDGLVHVGEEDCDGNDLQGTSCLDLGFGGGALTCSPTCAFDTTFCTFCGDGNADPGEECDGLDFGGSSCAGELGFGFHGSPTCDASCTIDFASCYECGNGVIEPGEDCEGTDLGGATCASVVAAAPNGTLGCHAMFCEFNTTGCCIPDGQPCFGPGGPSCCNTFCALDLFLCI